MEILKTTILWTLRVLVAALLSSVLHAETVIQCPQQDEPLNRKWEWAKKEAQNQDLRNGFWIGYSIQRLMGEQEYCVTGTNIRFDEVRKDGVPSLENLVGYEKHPQAVREPDDQKVKRTAENALADLEHRKTTEIKVMKDLAVLFEFHSLQSAGPDDFAMLNTSLTMDLKKRPLIWLGRTDETQSLDLMLKYYREVNSGEVKEEMLVSIASHRNSALVLPFLREILSGTSPDHLRAAAAQSLGSHGSDEAIPLLLQVCKTDRSSEVREEALNGLAELSSAAARSAVIDLAKTAKDAELREEAVQRIVENATQKEIATIQGIVMNDPDQEVQEAALYALAELPGSTSWIIQVARAHPNRELREAALHALAENASKEAAAALEEIARKDPSEDLQEQALVALEELPDGTGIPILLDIARNHPRKEMRIRAVEVLGDSDNKEAKAALLKLLED